LIHGVDHEEPVLAVTGAAPPVLRQKKRRADAPVNLHRRPRRHNVNPNI
jgi:hypothetical protein